MALLAASDYYQTTSATNFTVSRLTKGVTYYFRVVATNSCPSTANSNTANATTTDPPVSCTNLGNFTLNTSPGANSVNLSWNTPSGTAPSSYSVYYGTTSPANTLSSSTSSNSATINGLASSTTYYFRIVATNSCSNSTSTGSATTGSGTPPPPSCTLPQISSFNVSTTRTTN